jgi:hypothetical protein
VAHALRFIQTDADDYKSAINHSSWHAAFSFRFRHESVRYHT